MDALVYPRERTLGSITLVIGLLIWLGLVVGTFGAALLVLLAGFVVYLFAQSALIAHIKGNGVELSANQFPDLHEQFTACCERLQLKATPQAYVLNGHGGLNAFATQFLGTQYVVLYSDVVDAMAAHADGVRFYIGHELGHLRMKHLTGHLLRWPALWLPLVGAAYSRARESTCDRHGAACCATREGGAKALAALAAGAERWQQLDVASYSRQADQTGGFWMSFHELTAGYPWLTKRAARVLDADAQLPSRHGLAYLPALFIPYAGRLGAGFGVLIMVYVIGVLAAIGLPAYQNYTMRAKLSAVVASTEAARNALARHYQASRTVPESLEAIGVAPQLTDGTSLALNSSNMVLTVNLQQGELVFTPSADDTGRVTWTCAVGEGSLTPAQLPASCSGDAAGR